MKKRYANLIKKKTQSFSKNMLPNARCQNFKISQNIYNL